MEEKAWRKTRLLVHEATSPKRGRGGVLSLVSVGKDHQLERRGAPATG